MKNYHLMATQRKLSRQPLEYSLEPIAVGASSPYQPDRTCVCVCVGTAHLCTSPQCQGYTVKTSHTHPEH